MNLEKLHQERLQNNFYTWIIVAIDPAVTTNDLSAETGIIVAAKDTTGHFYILDDLSGRFSVDIWIKKAIDAAKYYQADRIVAETNQGGDLVESLLRQYDHKIDFTAVRALKNKESRAEPIISLYQQNRVTHMKSFDILEKHMTTAVYGKNTEMDRIDALVWGLTFLINPPLISSRFQAQNKQSRFMSIKY